MTILIWVLVRIFSCSLQGDFLQRFLRDKPYSPLKYKGKAIGATVWLLAASGMHSQHSFKRLPLYRDLTPSAPTVAITYLEADLAAPIHYPLYEKVPLISFTAARLRAFS
jgi:hypothetical protein